MQECVEHMYMQENIDQMMECFATITHVADITAINLPSNIARDLFEGKIRSFCQKYLEPEKSFG